MSDEEFREFYAAVVRNDQHAFRRLKGKLLELVELVAGTAEQQATLKSWVVSILLQVERDHASDRYRTFDEERQARALPASVFQPR